MKNVTSTTAWLAGTVGVIALLWACNFGSGLLAQADELAPNSPELPPAFSIQQLPEDDELGDSDEAEPDTEEGDEREQEHRRRGRLRGEWDQEQDEGTDEDWTEENGDWEQDIEDLEEDRFEEDEWNEGEGDEGDFEDNGNFEVDDWEEADQDWGDDELGEESERFEDEFGRFEHTQHPGEISELLYQVATDEHYSAAFALEKLAMHSEPEQILPMLEQLRSETPDPVRLRMIHVMMIAIQGEAEQSEQSLEIVRRLFLGN